MFQVCAEEKTVDFASTVCFEEHGRDHTGVPFLPASLHSSRPGRSGCAGPSVHARRAASSGRQDMHSWMRALRLCLARCMCGG